MVLTNLGFQMNLSKKQLIIISVVAVVAIAAVLIYFVTAPTNSQLIKYDNQPLPASTYNLFHVSNAAFKAVGIGSASNYPAKITGHPNLTADGKPAIVYEGAEFCPYCATERWPLIIALSRFGNFSGIKYMTSSSTDAFPNTATFTFVNATYSSPYITFVSLEFENNTGAQLQTATPLENQLISSYDPSGNIPFIDFANESYVVGATSSPETILGMDWNTIFNQINNTNSSVSQSILGSANLITAQICIADKNKPASVCAQPYIQQIEQFA